MSNPADTALTAAQSAAASASAAATAAQDVANNLTQYNEVLGVADSLAARIDGYTDHGDVSGAVTFNGPNGTHWFDATAAATITLAGFTEGQVVSLLPFSGAANVTVADAIGIELTDGLISSAMLARGMWVTGGGGGTAATPDTTPPSNLTGLVAGTPTSTTIPFSWAASTDSESTVRYAWRIKPTSGAYGAWTTGITGTSATATGLSASTDYTIEVYPYSSGGSATGMTVTTTTGAYVPASGDVLTSDSFSGAAGTVHGRTTDLYAGGIARQWTVTGGTTTGWVTDSSGRLTGPTASTAARMNYGYSGAAKVEFDVVAAGPNTLWVGVGYTLSSGPSGRAFVFGADSVQYAGADEGVVADNPTTPGANNVVGYQAPGPALASSLGHWTIQYIGTDFTVTRPDGYVWEGTATSAPTSTYLQVSSTGYTSGGWIIDNVKVSQP